MNTNNNELFFKYEDKTYPDLIRRGWHSQYIIPIAQKFCRGKVIDIGNSRDSWTFPGAQDCCDLNNKVPWNDAMKIPVENEYYNAIFSSHCLEHLADYFGGLCEWTRILKPGGMLFLYLPDSEAMPYWKPCNDRRHLHILKPEDLKYDLENLGYKNILISGTDLAFSWSIVGQKK